MPFAVGKRSYSNRSNSPSCAGRKRRTPRPSLPGRPPRSGGSGRWRRDRRSAGLSAGEPRLGRLGVRRTDVGRAPSRARGHRRRGPARPAPRPRIVAETGVREPAGSRPAGRGGCGLASGPRGTGRSGNGFAASTSEALCALIAVIDTEGARRPPERRSEPRGRPRPHYSRRAERGNARALRGREVNVGPARSRADRDECESRAGIGALPRAVKAAEA